MQSRDRAERHAFALRGGIEDHAHDDPRFVALILERDQSTGTARHRCACRPMRSGFTGLIFVDGRILGGNATDDEVPHSCHFFIQSGRLLLVAFGCPRLVLLSFPCRQLT